MEPLRAQDIPGEVFASLQAGDVLFVDTTHTVKIDSDVNRIVLDVLPALAPGVIVHVHDIFLPYEYPRVFAERSGLHWAEQYLLQAFLAGNRDYEVLAADIRALPRPAGGDGAACAHVAPGCAASERVLDPPDLRLGGQRPPGDPVVVPGGHVVEVPELEAPLLAGAVGVPQPVDEVVVDQPALGER